MAGQASTRTREEASTVAGAVALARDLTNMPSGRKTPAWLADEAEAVAAAAGLAARVWDAESSPRTGSAACSRWARARPGRPA